jgi:N-acetylglucosamine-6-phosphate deacetylase
MAATALPAGAQTSTSPLAPPPNGVREGEATWHALVGATVHVSPTETIEVATVVIRDGRIAQVLAGSDADGDGQAEAPPPPAGARAWDCADLHIYAGFIDPFVEVDVPVPASGTIGMHWNPLITPQRDALAGVGVARDVADPMRRMGFVAAGIVPRGGIIRGTTAVVSLGDVPIDTSRGRPPVYAAPPFLAVGFDTVGFGGGGPGAGAPVVTYPQSRIGSIALMRQSFFDAAWQSESREAGVQVEPNCLDEITAHELAPLLFDCDSELEALRAAYLAEEFGREGVLVGSGYEVRMLRPVVDMGWPLILPLNFPETPDVSSVGRIDGVSLTELMTWEQVPTGPRRFDQAGIPVSFTTAKIRRREQFDDNLRLAIEHGLPKERALAMLTTNPADLLGVSHVLGTLEAGKAASLIVATGDIFADGVTIRDVWVDGVRTEVNAAPDPKLDGAWDLEVIDDAGPTTGTLTFDAGRRVTSRIGDVESRGRNARLSGDHVSFLMSVDPEGEQGPPEGEQGEAVVSAVLVGDDTMVGQAVMPSGRVVQFSATRRGGEVDPAGVWSIDLGGGQTGKFTIRGERVTFEPAEGMAAPGRDVKVEGNVVTFTVETRPAGQAAEGGPASGDPRGGPGQPRGPGGQTPEGGDDPNRPLPGTPSGATPATPGGAPPTPPSAAPGVQPPEGAGDEASSVVTTIRAEITGDSMTGTRTLPDGAAIDFTGARTPLPPEDARMDEPPAVPEEFGYPFGPYARTELPEQELLIIRNATIWTSAEAGIIRDGSLMVSGGEILYVGDDAGLSDLLSRIRLTGPPREIDAAGRHITPGLIDCHSHTGLTDINEGGQSCSAEVRIADAADPTDISWYRQLAGGITTVNSLHGSANAIGGQNLVQKPRWGSMLPQDFFFEDAPWGIKFALGENPKRGNSYGTGATNRYPQTRMGVEAVIRDRFTAAREYAAARLGAGAGRAGPVRRDLELEALAEILSGQRLVHCHSYRADEILMLCNVAAEFGFKIGTFQHALEVYKVAPEVRQAAIGASAFSDWWAYKVEVQDAIPYAGAIMHDAGIVVSFNSDSDELARRMNLEAAKAVRYGGVDPAEALKFVTINPAIQLGIADRVGSLEAGKVADFVIWSGDPLSTMSRCEATYIDGRRYFSLEDDAAMRERNQAERTRIIQRILADSRPADREPGGEGERGEPGRPGVLGMAQAAAMDSMSRHTLDLIRQGVDPEQAYCGDCGMTWQQLMGW